MNKPKTPRRLNRRLMIEPKKKKQPETNIEQANSAKDTAPIRKTYNRQHSVPIYSTARVAKLTYSTLRQSLVNTSNDNTDTNSHCEEQFFDAQSNISLSGSNLLEADEQPASNFVGTTLKALSSVSLTEDVYYTPTTSTSQLLPGGDATNDGRLGFYRSNSQAKECSPPTQMLTSVDFVNSSNDGERLSMGDCSRILQGGLPLRLYPMPSTLHDLQPFLNLHANCYILLIPSINQLSFDFVPHLNDENPALSQADE